MLRFVLGLLYFFRFHFVLLFVKSCERMGYDICALDSHLHDFCWGEGAAQYTIKCHDPVFCQEVYLGPCRTSMIECFFATIESHCLFLQKAP